MEQAPSTEKTGPQKGDVIDGKLEIEGVIAEGRTSTVVSAIDRESGKKIAVKVARGSDLESIERFKRAALRMSKLTSPHAVKVLRVGTTMHGSPCMSMEYLEGRTLAQKITQSGPLPIDEATRWMLQACDAIAEAHSHKLLHRDLDAENLFLAMPPLGSGDQLSVRVLDFGLAPLWRLGKGDGRLRPGDVPGTSFAMAPELARGSDLDERVDIWGIGACLFRLLTNKHPYNARNLAELCTRILAERPPDLTKVRPDVPPALAAVVRKCLEREPNDRYASVTEVIAALEATKDEAPLTPQVKTERATLEEMRAIEDRMTPIIMPAARGALDDSEDETQIHRGSIGHDTPRTVRAASPFEAIATRLEPPKPKQRTDPPPPPGRSPLLPPQKKVSGIPPPLPPPTPTSGPSTEDGPSTQPLGRLSPFAELPKAPLIVDPPSSDGDRTIKPVLIGAGPAAAPLPKPTPARMNAETMPPPPEKEARPQTQAMARPLLAPEPAPLPKPSPAMMAAETIQGPTPPKPSPAVMAAETINAYAPTAAMPLVTGPPPPMEPLIFQASPRVLELPAPAVTGPPPPIDRDHLAERVAERMAERAVEPAQTARRREEEPRAKSKLIVPLLFALAIAVSIVIGLYVARMTLPSKEKEAATPPPSVTPIATPSVAESAPVESESAQDFMTAPDDSASSSPSPSSSHRRRHRPPPPVTTSAPSAAPVKTGSIYDPSVYDPK